LLLTLSTLEGAGMAEMRSRSNSTPTDPAALAGALTDSRDPDVAEALNSLDPASAARVLSALPFAFAVSVLDQPAFDHRARIFEHLPPTTAIAMINAMSADRQADLFHDLPEPHRTRLLPGLDAATRDSLKLLLTYPEMSAGGIMTTEYVHVPATWTVEQTLAHISEVGRAKETVYAVYVLDPVDGRLVRVVSLRELMVSDRTARVIDVGDPRPPISVIPLMDREDVARLISKYDLLAVPVLDDGGHMLGIVTVDDVIDAIVKEQTEDTQKFGGMQALDEPYMKIGFRTMIQKRAGWLCALFLSEMLTATAMQYFEGELSKALVLTLFIPLVMSSGGNSGSQATSLIVRALALHEVRLADWWRIAVRELPTGMTLGTILGVIGVIRIALWQYLGFYNYGPHWAFVALTVAGALVGVVMFGSLAGSMLPFVLRRLGFDPASASAPFVATLVDVTGLIIYFSVAYVVLRGTLL
jgi:magnesium transporter